MDWACAAVAACRRRRRAPSPACVAQATRQGPRLIRAWLMGSCKGDAPSDCGMSAEAESMQLYHVSNVIVYQMRFRDSSFILSNPVSDFIVYAVKSSFKLVWSCYQTAWRHSLWRQAGLDSIIYIYIYTYILW